jgi:hypothetical protein
LAYDFIDTYFFNLLNGYYLDGNAIRRNVIEQKNGNYIYYFIRDYAEADVEEWPDFQGMKLNFNGYGKQGVNASFSSTGNLHSWTGACNTSGFKISSNHCALAGGRIGTVSWELPQEIDAEDGTRANMVEFGNKVTRLQVFQPNKRSTIFHSAYFPQRCQDSLPKVTEIDTFENKLATIIEMVSQVDTFPNPFGGKKQNPLVNDSITHLHIGKLTGQAADSLQNPLARHNTINKTLYFNGSTIFLESHTLEKVNKDFRFCPSANIRIRNYFSREGSYLILDDTLYHSSIPLNFEYDFLGKDKFQCRLTNLATPSSTDTLKIKLTGVTRGLDFIALIDNTRDTLHGRFDSIAGYIYLAIKPNNYSFTIQRKDPCSDCYFPPYGTDFDTLFVADDGLEHTLGQSKKINQGHGNLSILNATRISLCPGVILHNKDSIIIQSGNQKLPEPMSSCAGIDSIKKHSANSMLIVSPNAALVLDAGSRTYIKNGASLYVKQNGSLIIKSGALVEVGDSGTLGNSEIKAEPGAFIYIEDQANIRYRTNTKDTTDKRNTINFAIGNGGVNAGIKFPIDTILQNDSILANPYVAIPVCQLDSINPIGNPYWGYTNFAKPQIHLRTKKLTLCPNEKFHLSLNRILNDAQAKITVCRMDSIQKLDRHGVLIWQDTCINDSIVLDSMPPDPTCLRPRATPDQWSYQFPVNSLHRVSISLRNECNKAVDSTFEVLVLDTPTMSIQVPNFACEGYGTVWAVANINRTGPVHHAFEVIELPDSLNPGFSGYKPAEEFTFDTLAAIPDTFNFPNYYFRGGRNYLLSFTIIDACGTVTVEKVVSIPTGAYVQLSRPTVYANPIHGAKSLQLNGYVNQADSFSWYPQDYLNRTDTLQVISTPVDSMYYVLTAYKGSCIARDTAFIKYNRVANAGLQDTVCFTGTKTLVGNAYDLSIFLGFMYFKGGSTFRDDWFITRTTANSEYFKYLSLFMHTTQFKNWAQSSNLYNDFTEDLHRAQTIKTPWFINYFEQLTEFTDPNLYALDTFVYYVNLNQALKNNYQQTGDFQNYVSYLTGFFSLYEDFVANNLNSYNISWIKISDGDTSYNGSLQESAIAIDEPAKTSIYIQKVITPEYAEFDETIVYVDTVLEVAFVPQLQMDSTVVFQNLTIPTDGISAFEWDFGDGSPTATEVHAFHTFPAFDTLFRVCLTATNECGSYSWCDTVYIDSAHWGGSMFKQKLKAPTETVNAISQDGIEAILFPNPTEGNCTISYRIQGEATLVITDAGGRTVWETALQVNRGQQQIPSQTFEAGLYFYHISTNVGSIQGKFIVQK